MFEMLFNICAWTIVLVFAALIATLAACVIWIVATVIRELWEDFFHG